MNPRLSSALAAVLLCIPLTFAEKSARGADAEAGAAFLFRQARESLQAWDTEGARKNFDAFRKTEAESGSGEKRNGSSLLLEANILFEESRLDEAAALLKDFDPASPGDSAAAKVILDTARLTDGYLTSESSHFRMRYPPGKDALLVPYALETLERARRAMEEVFGHAPKNKVTVEIYPTAESLSAATTLPLSAIKTTGTVAICKFSKIMAASPKSLIQGYTWLDTLAHEYVHLVVSQASGNRVPIWVHEGLAKFYETAWRSQPGDGGISPASAAFLAQEAKKNALIPFEKMHPSLALLPTQEDAALAYAEAFAAIEYLTSVYGTRSVPKLIDAYRGGLSDAQAFRSATGKSFASFVSGWKEYVKKRPAPGVPPVLDAEKRRFGIEGGEVHPAEDGSPNGSEPNEKFIISDFPDLKNPEAKRRAHLGELLRVRGRNRAAADEFRQAYAIARSASPTLSNRYAQALLAIPETEPDAANLRAKAAEILSESRRLFPSWPRTLKQLAEIFKTSGRDDDAARFYREAIAIDPFDPELHVNLAALCEEKLRDEACAVREKTALDILRGKIREWPSADSQMSGPGAVESSASRSRKTSGGIQNHGGGTAAASGELVRLTVESRPFGQIEIDGKPTGRTTPSTFHLPPGRHEIRVFNDGLDLDERREIPLTPGVPSILRASRKSSSADFQNPAKNSPHRK